MLLCQSHLAGTSASGMWQHIELSRLHAIMQQSIQSIIAASPVIMDTVADTSGQLLIKLVPKDAVFSSIPYSFH